MKMMLISVFVKDLSELDGMKEHFDKKRIPWEVRQDKRTGRYALYRQYKAVGKSKLPEPLPDRRVWDNKR